MPCRVTGDDIHGSGREALANWEAAKRRGGNIIGAARQVHDAVTLGLFYGHMPPLRVQPVINLAAPSYEGPCRCGLSVEISKWNAYIDRGWEAGERRMHLGMEACAYASTFSTPTPKFTTMIARTPMLATVTVGLRCASVTLTPTYRN